MSDIFGGPPEDEYDDSAWWGESEPASWWTDNYAVFGDYGEVTTQSAETWYWETLQGDDYLLDNYGLDTIELIHELEMYGLWTDEDWETWREMYGEQ